MTGTPSLFLMQHFLTDWSSIISIPRSEELIGLMKSSSIIRNTLFALSASHLRHIAPGNIEHHIAERAQLSLALKDCRIAFCTPTEELAQSGANTLLLSAALLSILTFTLPHLETTPDTEGNLNLKNSWVFDSSSDRLGWIALQAGLRPLLKSMPMYVPNTMNFLGPILFGEARSAWEFLFMDRGLEDVPKHWITTFQLSGTTNGCNSTESTEMKHGQVFRPLVNILLFVRTIEPVPSNTFKVLQFIFKIQREFRDLLFRRDERALWLFGYWLGVVCRFKGTWWSEQRARRDYRAISLWLEQLNLPQRQGSEGEMWREMMDEFHLSPIYSVPVASHTLGSSNICTRWLHHDLESKPRAAVQGLSHFDMASTAL
jgi:hypothetical protein